MGKQKKQYFYKKIGNDASHIIATDGFRMAPGRQGTCFRQYRFIFHSGKIESPSCRNGSVIPVMGECGCIPYQRIPRKPEKSKKNQFIRQTGIDFFADRYILDTKLV
jgi:hypothetical protein